MDVPRQDEPAASLSSRDSERGPATRPHRRFRPRPLDVTLAAVVLWLVVCGTAVRSARGDAERGIVAVERAEGLLAADDLVEGTALGPLGEAKDAFARARRSLDHPFLLPLKVLPVVGRQVRSARALTGASNDVAALGSRAVREAQAVLAQPRGTGPERVALIRRLGAAAARFERELAGVELGPGEALVGPLAERRAELVERLDDVRQTMGKSATVATGVAELLEGPGRYLVLGANNAEMRAGSGMFLSVGVVSFSDGTMALSAFAPAAELELRPQAAPPIGDADLAARWGWLNPNREWRNLAASPRFPASAELAARMWAARGEDPVDGVLLLDPVALEGFLSSTGPVVAAGMSVASDGLLDLLLHDQYAGIDEGGEAAQAARREMLGHIAIAVLDAVQREDTDIAALATALSSAAAGRHVMAWAADPAAQKVWDAAGVTGALTERSLAVAILNRAANKLDPFLDVDVTLGLDPAGPGTAAELRLVVRNRTPEGENSYVGGGGRLEGVDRGDYQGLISVNLPGFVGHVEVESDPPLAAAGDDGPTTVVAWQIQVERGATVTAVVRFRLPEGAHGLVVEPSARVPAVAWRFRGQSWESGPRRELAW